MKHCGRLSCSIMWYARSAEEKTFTCSSLPAPELKCPSRPLSCEGCRVRAPPASLNMAHLSSRLSRFDMGRARGLLGDGETQGGNGQEADI
ncbi:hypothetical protein EYF80_026144 [Liparis tanakae]|uniref:Uncharacterized protein n=1 Tax=Liparis tanakae TaxID=230148 RepID=A0A4Z2HCL3_9TELE|nr:hypothetical protein EYF80_026144 [Liparis tanakae]